MKYIIFTEKKSYTSTLLSAWRKNETREMKVLRDAYLCVEHHFDFRAVFCTAVEVWMRFLVGLLVVAIWVYVIYDSINRTGRSCSVRVANGAHVCFIYRISLSAAGKTAFNFHRTFYRELSGLTGIFSFAGDCVTVSRWLRVRILHHLLSHD